MDTKKLQPMYDNLFEIAKKVIADGEQHVPMLVVYDLSGEAAEIRTIAALAIDKDGIGSLVRRTAQELGKNSGALLINECWYRTSGKDDPHPGVPVSEMPDRKEAVAFYFFGRDWEAMSNCEIKRPSNELAKGDIIVPDMVRGSMTVHGSGDIN